MNSAPGDLPMVFTDPEGRRKTVRGAEDSSASRIHIYLARSEAGANVFFSHAETSRTAAGLIERSVRDPYSPTLPVCARASRWFSPGRCTRSVGCALGRE